MIIRRGHLGDLTELQQLFVETIRETCRKDYDDHQIAAWISGIENTERWQKILTTQFVLVALYNQTITGFCTLENGSYIDLLYVHKDYQRQGIAYKLYCAIEEEAKRLEQTELTSDVSKSARPFFESVGFKIINEQTVVRQGVELMNFKMKKELIK